MAPWQLRALVRLTVATIAFLVVALLPGVPETARILGMAAALLLIIRA